MRVGEAARPPRQHRGFSDRTNNTVLARLLNRQNIRRMDLCATLRISERQGYNIMSRARPLDPPQLMRLCELLDVDPEEIVDDGRFLLLEDESCQKD